MSTTQALHIDDAVLHAVLSSPELAVQDVLRASRTCKRLHQLIMEVSLLWVSLYQRDHGGAAPAAPRAATAAAAVARHARLQYKQRYVSKAQERRINRRVQQIKLLSAIQTSSGRLKALQEQQAQEQKRRDRLQSDLRHLEHVRRVQSTAHEWQLQSFKLYANKVAQAVPIEAGWRIKNLQQDVKESESALHTLKRSITSTKAQLKREQAKLKAFEQQGA